MSTITITYSNVPTANTISDLISGWFLYKGIPILKLITGECLYVRDLGSSKFFDYYPYQIKGYLTELLSLDSTSIDSTSINVSLKNQNYSVIVLTQNESSTLAIRVYDTIYSLVDGEVISAYNHTALYEKANTFELSFLGSGSTQVPELPYEG